MPDVSGVKPERRTSFVREGVCIHRESGPQTLPLLSGSVHYWQLEPAAWRTALSAVKSMGFRLVDTYVPWSVHEQSDGTFDFGQSKASLDVGLFLRIAHELGLHAIVRPGPHIHAELS